MQRFLRSGLMSKKLDPPVNGDTPVRLMWSPIIIHEPGEKPGFIAPAAFVRINLVTPAAAMNRTPAAT